MSLVHSTVMTAWSVAYTQNYKVLLFQCLYGSMKSRREKTKRKEEEDDVG